VSDSPTPDASFVHPKTEEEHNPSDEAEPETKKDEPVTRAQFDALAAIVAGTSESARQAVEALGATPPEE
jgi:hypothetical protein